jgi:hypothetical protein
MIKFTLKQLVEDSAKDISVEGIASGRILKDKYYQQAMEREYYSAEQVDKLIHAIKTNDLKTAQELIISI